MKYLISPDERSSVVKAAC